MIDIFCSAEFRDWNCRSIFMRVEDELEIPPAPQSQHFQNWTHHPSSLTTKTTPPPVFLTSALPRVLKPETQQASQAPLPLSTSSVPAPSLPGLTSYATRHSVNVIHPFVSPSLPIASLSLGLVISCFDSSARVLTGLLASSFIPCQSFSRTDPRMIFLNYMSEHVTSLLEFL